MAKRYELSVCAVALALLLSQASLAQVGLFTESRNVVAGDSAFLSVNKNNLTPVTGRGQIVSVSSSGVRLRATLINGFEGELVMAGLTASGASVPGCQVVISAPVPKPPAETLCPTTAVRYGVAVVHGGDDS